MKYRFMRDVDPAVLEQLTAAERWQGTSLIVDALGEVLAELA